MACYELRVAQLPTEADRLGYQSLLTEVVSDGIPLGSVQLDASLYRHRPLTLQHDDAFWSAVAAWAVERSLRCAVRQGALGRDSTMRLDIDDYQDLATRRAGPEDRRTQAFLEVGKPITLWEQ